MVWDMTYRLLGVDVFRGGLCFAEDPEELDLAIVEAAWLAVAGHVYGSWVGAVEFGECADCVVPPEIRVSLYLAARLAHASLHLRPLFWADIWY